MYVFDRPRESLGQAVDPSVLRINELRVVPHALVRQAQSAVDDLFQGGFRNRPAYPIGRNRPQILLPELFVVRKHEMFCDAASKSSYYPIVKVFWAAIAVDMHAFNESDDALFHDFGRQSVGVCLKWVRRRSGFRINRRLSLVRTERLGKKPRDEFFRVFILEMNQMARAIECEAVLRE